MGLFDSIGRALGGAASGFAMGGPLGAAGGLISGLLPPGNTGQQTVTRQARAYSPQEQQIVAQAQEALLANMQGMTPEQQEEYISGLAGTYYEPMARAIQTQFVRSEGLGRIAHARGGMLSSSTAAKSRRRLQTDTATAQGAAAAQARQMGEQSYFQREANRRGNVATSQGVLSNMENLRLASSGQQTTTSYPDRFPSDMMTGLGFAMTSPFSYMNQSGILPSWLTGKKKQGPVASPFNSQAMSTGFGSMNY